MGNKGTRLDQDLPFNFANPGPGNVSDRRPLLQFGGGQRYSNSGNSIYHALQITPEKRFSAGLTFLESYTWSKLIDDTNVSDGNFAYQNPANLALDRAPGNSGIRHRSTTSFPYEMPFGRGRQFGSSSPRPLDLVAGGWQLAGILTFQSGIPFSPTQSADPANTQGGFGYRPDVASTDLYPANQIIGQWFNVNAFAIPTRYTYGNAGRNILRGPSYNNVDLSLLKHFNFTESKLLELRFEAFNSLNHPNFLNPDSNIQSPTAGEITGAFDPRILQVALKFYF